ncbi:unnamed protein product [Adineta steineri]|uniref:ADP ribosyltransferase domain-containing protein n=1 Tax=Adineta steineri TaxID=433720 RepID=A0A814WZ70_9BILA|nr:unnamed protein product [Adineta steineri]CAF3618655.1 unnamed protein product [Adineta steineri]
MPSTRNHMAQNYLLVWVDANIDQTNKDCQNTLAQLRTVVNDVVIFNQSDACVQFLDKLLDEKAFVITSGSLGPYFLVPAIHHMPKLDAIYILYGDISYHQQWIKNWKKIKGVHNNIKDICDALKGSVKQMNQDSISISFVTMNEALSSENQNQLEPSYMYTQIFKDILLEMNHDHPQALKDLAAYYRQFYHDNMSQLNIIDEFEQNYRQENAISWYTRECFTYEILNRALRTLDADIIINMGFFIHDLHQQIHQLHQQQLPSYGGNPFKVYRGQGLLKTDFDKLKRTKGGLMSLNNFLSTSMERHVSLFFADSASGDPDKVGILFMITIDPRVSSIPFASIKEVSYYKTEEEILFSMHAVFRIGEIKEMGDNHRLYQVELQTTNDDDEQLQQLTEFISKEIAGATGWGRLGVLLTKTGHFDKAEELYKVLLEQPSTESDKALYYHCLGYVKHHQGNYEQAIEYYTKALGIREKNFPANSPSLATSYNNIGGVYDNIKEYSKALSFYEKALEIDEKSLPANSPSLATSYNNIGSVYSKMGEYLKALSYYEKALGIYEKSLPANHPELATSYNNIGLVYNNLGEYLKALSFYEKAFEVWRKTLPSNHPNLAASYNNIGLVYNNLGEYWKALSFYEKTLGIQEKTLPSNHPDLAESYNNIGSVYNDMGEYSKTLFFYRKALGIRQEALPANHLELATSYNNIGSVYDNMGEYLKALSFYEKALEIKEKTLPANHPDLATFYNNIGTVYHNMGEYLKALSFHEKALSIREKTLSENHPHLAQSYNNIGETYREMGAYSKALIFHEKTLGMREKTLPTNHPHLALSYNNVGLVYNNMGEYLKSLSFYEKALGIREVALPENHPELANIYRNIGTVYYAMKEYLKSLSFYEKALKIQEKTLSENHPDLATSYNNFGGLYYRMKEYLKALSYFERALDIWQSALPPNHPNLEGVKKWIEAVRKQL